MVLPLSVLISKVYTTSDCHLRKKSKYRNRSGILLGVRDMAYLIGSILGSIFKVFLLSRGTRFLVRKLGIKKEYEIPVTYLLYILIFWPLTFLINDVDRSIRFILLDLPAITLWMIVDVLTRNKPEPKRNFFEL